MRRAAPVIVVLALAGAGALWWWSRAPDDAVAVATPEEIVDAPRSVGPRPNILLFTIDTLRADHVSSYGHLPETTPTLDALSTRGTRFTRAYSSSAWTAPALASVVTGLPPAAHGVLHGLPVATRIVRQEALAESLPSLATSLAAAGYYTVGVTSNGHLTSELGFGRGFARYENVGFTGVDRVGAALAPLLESLASSEAPFFLWIHVLEPHSPYALGPRFDALWPPDRPRFDPIAHIPFPEALPIALHRLPNEDELAFLAGAYDADIRAADDYLGEVLGALPMEPLAVVVVSDHGEELREHGRLGHGHQLYDETVHVPLVIAVPGGEARVVDTPVSLIDVMPTLLDLGGAAPEPSVTGRSLVPAAHGEVLTEVPLLLETSRVEQVRGLVEGPLKLIVRLAPSPAEMLFDVVADPGETHDLAAERPADVARLRERMEALIAAAEAGRPEAVTVPISEEELERLRALGYGH